MKTVLKRPETTRYTIADHLAFHEASLGICKKHVSIIGNEDYVLDYELKVGREDGIYKWMRRSDYTARKAEADRGRDETSLGMSQVVRANLHHFSPEIRDAATHVNNLLENYGNFRESNYDAETVAVDSIVARLQSANYLPAVNVLGLGPWVEKLAADNALFKTYALDANEEQADKPEITTSTARRETDGSLRRITDRVTSLMNLNGPEGYAPFADDFNGEVKHYNTLLHEHYGRLHVRTDIAPALVDEIPPQAATGYPVYVIPALRLRRVNREGVEETVLLVFSTDFTVAYKNNVSPGTATLVARGIGKYRGEIVTTFTIR
jgi:hypothetical protein